MLIDDILAEDDRPIVEVKTPEWKCGKVYVRSLSALELIGMEDAAGADATPEGRLAIQLSIYLCDEKGDRICNLEQGKALARKSANAVRRILTAGNKLNGRSEAEQEEIKGKS